MENQFFYQSSILYSRSLVGYWIGAGSSRVWYGRRGVVLIRAWGGHLGGFFRGGGGAGVGWLY